MSFSSYIFNGTSASGSSFTLQVDLRLTIIMVLWDALTSGTAEIWRHSVPLPRKGNHNSISILLLGKGNYNWGKIILLLNYHQQPCDVEETEFRCNIKKKFSTIEKKKGQLILIHDKRMEILKPSYY